jgi:hypothetical protein
MKALNPATLSIMLSVGELASSAQSLSLTRLFDRSRLEIAWASASCVGDDITISQREISICPVPSSRQTEPPPSLFLSNAVTSASTFHIVPVLLPTISHILLSESLPCLQITRPLAIALGCSLACTFPTCRPQTMLPGLLRSNLTVPSHSLTCVSQSQRCRKDAA